MVDFGNFVSEAWESKLNITPETDPKAILPFIREDAVIVTIEEVNNFNSSIIKIVGKLQFVQLFGKHSVKIVFGGGEVLNVSNITKRPDDPLFEDNDLKRDAPLTLKSYVTFSSFR